ncbi:MAG: ATP-dependent DNA ligase [Thermoleophilaceae bacterium]|nr:ATP-dependent DNA ligase [Thermoleophilaceae bacterium]
MALPLEPPLKPQLAKSARELPEGDQWRYEPKLDGFRTIAFRDGEEVHLQSRNGKPLNRYFPEVVKAMLAVEAPQFVIDGETLIVVDGVHEFNLLSQRIHPADSRVQQLAKETPAGFVGFDLLATGDRSLLELPYTERRVELEQVCGAPISLAPMTADREAAGVWLTGTSEGVVAKLAESLYLPGQRKGMVKIKRLRTADAVVVAFRFGKEPDTVGSLILGMYAPDGELRVVGHTSGFSAKQKRELLDLLEPYRSGERGSAEPSRWKADEELQWEGLRPELVCEISFDHVTGERIRHGTKLLRWRDDKQPGECHTDQLHA